MNKHLLSVAGAMLSVLVAAAINPAVFDGLCLSGVSPDGTWAAGDDNGSGIFVVVNLSNDEQYVYGPGTDDENMYVGGLGHFVSNNGVVVASVYGEDKPYYWHDECWYPLPIHDTDYGAYPNAITPDGSRITGSVSKTPMSVDATDVMVVPVVWDRNADGSYAMYREVAHPTVDWTGRTPQYVLVDDISADGKVLAGDIVDYSGFNQQPVVFTEDADGVWSYTLVHPELLNPAGLEFPAYPGEAPSKPEPVEFMSPANAEAYTAEFEAYINRPLPEETDFMTADELAAYEAAIVAFYEDFENNPYPYASDFMTEAEMREYVQALDDYYDYPAPESRDFMTADEYKDYEAALVAYDDVFKQWQIAANAFDDVLWDVMISQDIRFSMNSARISPNGRYFLMGSDHYYSVDPTDISLEYASVPVLFDLSDGSYTRLDQGQRDVMATMVFDNGAVIGGSPSQVYWRSGVISPAAGEPFVLVSDYVKDKSPEVYEWMQANMTHEILTTGTGAGQQIISGTPVASSDLKTIVSWAYNGWDMTGEDYYTYVFPLDIDIDGISDVTIGSGACSARLSRGGLLRTSGAVHVTISDIHGRVVRDIANPAATIGTALPKGVYIVKATAADGSVSLSKAAI